MPYFARRLKSPREWVAIDPTTPDNDFSLAVVAELNDPNGLSFWKVEAPNSADVERLVAALHDSNRTRFEAITLAFVDAGEVEALGIKSKLSKGASFDDIFARQAHWDLTVNTVGQAVALARALAKTDTRIFNIAQVVGCFVRSAQAGNFNIGACNKELVKDLLTKDAFTLRDPTVV